MHNRHQTLEDLRSELRTRSQTLSQELLDLVNAHYGDFLGLGTSLKGGEDKVQEVWGGLRGFQREVEGIRTSVVEREEEVAALVKERRKLRGEMERARDMISWEGRLGRLEERLMINGLKRSPRVKANAAEQEDESDDDSDSDSDFDDQDAEDSDRELEDTQYMKLNRRVQDYRLLEYLAAQIGEDHAFVTAQRPRLTKCRNTILLDLSNSLRQSSAESKTRLKLMSLYSDLDAAKEAIDVLQKLSLAK